MNHPPAGSSRRERFRLLRARLALLWESAWVSFWPAIGIAGAFLAAALLDILPELGGPLHLAILVVAVIAFVLALRRGLVRLAVPSALDGRRRIERASGLEHRPLAALDDRLANDADPAARALWRAYQARLRQIARRLVVGWPAPGLARRDPWAVRALVGLLLVVGLVAGWREPGVRIARALTPDLASQSRVPAATVSVWLNPPAYTHLPPQLLVVPTAENPQPAPLVVPAGSELLAKVHGGRGQPVLQIDEGAAPFESVDPLNHQARATLERGERIRVRQGSTTLADWAVRVIADQPPTIAFQAEPEAAQRGALRLAYTARDDYGIAKVTAEVRRFVRGAPTDEAPVEVGLPLPGIGLSEAQGVSYNDLTPHPWAGLPVEIRLIAADDLGQTGQSEPVVMALPERTFTHPVARAIVAERRRLTTEPEQRREIARAILGIAARPGAYRDDVVVFLGLKTASSRLVLDGSPQTIAPIQGLLWDLALRVEDGALSLAERELRELERQIQEALARNASDEELERLLDQLQKAIDKVLEAMMRNMMEQGQQPQERMQGNIDPRQMIQRQDLQDMVNRAREMMRSGARDAARRMLQRLQEMMANLRAGRMQQMTQEQQQAREMMRDLQDLVRRQQELLDQTFREANRQRGEAGQQGEPRQRDQQQRPGAQRQPGMPNPMGRGQQGEQGQHAEGSQPGGEMDPEALAQMQEELRRQLGELMRRMGELMGDIPQPFGRAERSMKDATEALDRAEPGEATGPQTEALNQLQQGSQSLQQQMQQQMMMSGGQGEGPTPGQEQQGQANPRDPLGRNRQGTSGVDTGDVQIPADRDIMRSREIFEELRRRAGEAERPRIELDYIDRLLRRF